MENYEQKYKQALERAKECHIDGLALHQPVKVIIEHIFPELGKGKDELIKEELIHFLETCRDPRFVGNRKQNEWIDWIEKHINIDKDSYEIAEKEKNDFVSGQFIECRKSFNEFKEDTSYWFEYIGNDTYIGRSDNILGKKFHITPKQLYQLFTQEHCPKENNVNEETYVPTAYGKYIDKCLNDAAKHFFSKGEDSYSVADLFRAGVKCGQSVLEKQEKQLYIRFGEIPTDEKSKIYQGEMEVGTENGVSVYPAFKTKEGDIVLGLSLPITKTTLHTQQHLLEYDDRPCYLVKGDYVGKDADGQLLINNVSIIEKIDNYRIKEEKQNVTNIISELENYFATTTKEQQEKDWEEIKKWEEKYFNHNKHKFRIGDTICCGDITQPITITGLSADSYQTDSIYSCIPFSEENKWELITSWNEKDENMFSRLYETLNWVKESNYSLTKSVKEYIHWLQSLKQRLNGYEH